MATVEDAVFAIRHVVQEHGDQETVLGKPADQAAFQWFGQLLGWSWPESYLKLLARHNGVIVQHAILLSFLQSIEIFLLYREHWYRPVGYWPIAGDGCGNYYVLEVGDVVADGECPVTFIDTMADMDRPAYRAAATYADFVVLHLKEQCENYDCTELSALFPAL